MRLLRFSSRALNTFSQTSSRCLSTKPRSEMNATAVELCDGHFNFQIDGGETKLSFLWLRDHCRSSSMYNHRTHQRATDILKLDASVQPVNYHVQGDNFSVKWSDGHESSYLLSWLAENTRPLVKTRPRLWTQSTAPSMPSTTVEFDEYMTTDCGLSAALSNLLEHGFTFVEGAPVSTEAGTRVVVERLAPVCLALYGGMWEFTSQHSDDVSDTAYTDQGLGPHTDTTYLTEAMGLQVFHCLKQAEQGGENLLVDGFSIGKIFKEQNPEGYEFLSKAVPVETEYKHTHSEPNQHYYNVDFVFKHDPVSQELCQFRYNEYDRAPHLLPLELQNPFYKHYMSLSKLVNSRENALWVKLRPGTVLIVNNWRVMHARTSFVGQRIMSGCYVSRADFLSKAKCFGLL